MKKSLFFVTVFSLFFFACGSDPVPTICEQAVDSNAGGFQAGTGTVADPYIICTAAQLNLIGQDATLNTKAYKLEADIDLSGVTFNIIGATDEDITLIVNGEPSAPNIEEIGFRGSFDGNNKTISNLSITGADLTVVAFINAVGSGGEVENLTLSGLNLNGRNYIAGLVGLNLGTIDNCSTSGTITSVDTVTVSQGSSLGGLVAMNADAVIFDNTYTAKGTITGSNSSCLVSSEVATDGVDQIAGLVGVNMSTITNSYATGAVVVDGTDNLNTGGLIGLQMIGTLSNSYATGNVEGPLNVAGLIGKTGLGGPYTGGTVTNCYSTGKVEGGTSPGGIAAGFIAEDNGATITSSYWDMTTSEQATSVGGGVGKTTAEMKTQSTFTGWDFDTIWTIEAGAYPTLR